MRTVNPTLHSNMFLLIQNEFFKKTKSFSGFTFQYVSINTPVGSSRTQSDDSALHSNMFLLIHLRVCAGVTGKSLLYIPICFY